MFLIPKSKYKDKKQYFLTTFTVTGIGLFSLFCWQVLISQLGFEMNRTANVALQLQFILTHPVSYIEILINTAIIKSGRLFITMIGVLGWQDTPLDFLTYMLYPVLIFLSIGCDRDKNFVFTKSQKFLISSILSVAVFFIFTTLYLMWDKIGAAVILGLNGKYFIPLMPLFLLLFKNKIRKLPRKTELFIFIMLIFILISS